MIPLMNNYKKKALQLLFCLSLFCLQVVLAAPEQARKNTANAVHLGVDRFFETSEHKTLKGKRVGLILNQTSYSANLEETYELFKKHAKDFKITALFSPEHGIEGDFTAEEKFSSQKHRDGIPIYSLHGTHYRPTAEMLKEVDVLVFDIQEIGSRSYTYATTLFYVMEEAAKKGIAVIVLDRPNPLGGLMVEGPMLKEKWRSFVGYVNVPYCHGMTIGELAQFFNKKHAVGCKLKVISMEGWQRWMRFSQTGLHWIPPSPNIPEADTPYFYPSTGIMGLGLVNIGIGYTLPFKIMGAPWIDARKFAKVLNEQHLPGVKFQPFHFKPFYGLYKGERCQGVKIVITNPSTYRPLTVQYFLIGVLKNLYPEKVKAALDALPENKRKMFCYINGNEEMWNILAHEKYVAWKFVQVDKEERARFIQERKKYLLY